MLLIGIARIAIGAASARTVDFGNELASTNIDFAGARIGSFTPMMLDLVPRAISDFPDGSVVQQPAHFAFSMNF